jgi:transglutaminase-like putative cysteine protease
MPLVSIRHLTAYRYRNPVALGEHRMMLRPLESYDQRIVSAELSITPEPSVLRHVHDVFGNCVAITRFAGRTDRLRVESRMVLEHTPQPAEFDGEYWGQTLPFAYSPEDAPDLARSMERHHPDPDGVLEAWARRFVKRSGPTSLRALLTDMTHAIHQGFTYGTRLSGAPQAPLETLALGTGSCRDFAMLMIEAVRSLGLAARFVSGYVYSAQGRPHRRRPYPRLGAGLPALLRLGGVRSDQRHHRQRRPCARGDRARPAPSRPPARNMGRPARGLPRNGR